MPADLKRQYIAECEALDCDIRDYRFELTRRELGLFGLGLVCTVRGASAAARPVSRLHIGDDGIVTVLTGKVELGQGVRTAMASVVAAELRVPMSRVRVMTADTDLSPDDGGTWGSLTCPQTIPVVRKAAEMLRFELDRTDGSVPHIRFEIAPVNGLDIVTGAQKYPTDVSMPGMLHGKAVRSAAYKAEAASVAAAKGVVHDGGFVGVVAPTAAAAARAARGVKVQWKAETLPSKAVAFARFKEKSVPPKPGEGGRYPALVKNGNLERGAAQVARRHEATYTLPYIAHVPLEPRAAIAEWKDGRLTVWSGTQAPFLVRKELATALRIPETSVRVISVGPGGAFGGKQRGEVDLEAARLAKDAGAPVKVAWTREEEFTASYCRPAGIVEVASGLDTGGMIHVWQHRNYNSGAASLVPPYTIPHYSCEYHRSESPLRQGSYRSLAGVANTFARESHVNELAALVGADPLEFRMRNLEDLRLRNALERGAEVFGWRGRKGRAVGVACNIEKDARLALFVEMDVATAVVRVLRMVFVFDVGLVIDPDGLINQSQGALIQGIGGALFEELDFNTQNITNGRLSKYRVPRFSDVPEIQVILMSRPQVPPTGAGEAPITVVAPAMAAALKGHVQGDLRTLPFARKRPA